MKKITRLKCQNEVCLVLGREDRKVYVRKCLKIYNPKVYETLKTIRNIHIPRVYDLKEQDGRIRGAGAVRVCPDGYAHGYFSLGVMMNYMLTGQSYKSCPYDGKAGKVIRRCTYMDPEKRYKEIQEVEGAVRKLLYPDEGKENQVKKLFLPPGFRSRKMWRMLAGTSGYLYLMYCIYAVAQSSHGINGFTTQWQLPHFSNRNWKGMY